MGLRVQSEKQSPCQVVRRRHFAAKFGRAEGIMRQSREEQLLLPAGLQDQREEVVGVGVPPSKSWTMLEAASTEAGATEGPASQEQVGPQRNCCHSYPSMLGGRRSALASLCLLISHQRFPLAKLPGSRWARDLNKCSFQESTSDIEQRRGNEKFN